MQKMYIKTGVAQITDDGDVLNVTVLSPNSNPQSLVPIMEEYNSEQPQEIDINKLSQQQELIQNADDIYAVSWDSGRKTNFGSIDGLKQFLNN
jgi:hypothetical protein